MVSLILTTLNEERTLAGLLDDILGQTRKPQEFVVVDAGSRDGTVALLELYRSKFADADVALKVVVAPKANIAKGRNQAIAVATGDLVAVTDAGCRLEPTWLERLSAPLLDGSADLVGGFYLPIARTGLQESIAMLTTAAKPSARFLPSSRSVAFTRALWSRVGGYPEWLRWGEDTLFDASCLRAGARYSIAADAIVHWEVRGDLRALVLQYFRYAYGDGLAGTVSRSHLVLQAVWWTALIGGALVTPWLLYMVAAYPIVWMMRRQVTRPSAMPRTFAVALLIQAMRFVGFAWGSLHRVSRARRTA